MTQKEFLKYLETQEFRDLLERYEESLGSGGAAFFDADDLIDIAEYYHLDGRLHNSKQAIELCLTLYPNDTAALLFSARIALIYLGDTSLARELYNKVSDKDENAEAAYIYAEILIVEGKAEEADAFLEGMEKLLQNAENNYHDDDLEEEEDAVNFPLDVAVIFTDHNCADIAEKWINRAVAQDKEQQLDIWETKARIHMMQNRMEEAEVAWNKVLDGDAYNYAAWMRLCDVQHSLGKYEEALQSSEYAIAISPDLPDAYMTKGNSLFSLNNLEEALKSFNKYLEFFPDDPMAHTILATIYYCLNNEEQAKEHIGKALERVADLSEQGEIDTYHLAACIASKAGDAVEAWMYSRKHAAAGASVSDNEILKGMICLEDYRDDEAKEHFMKAIENANGDLSCIIKVGLTLYDFAAYDAAYDLLLPMVTSVSEGQYHLLPNETLPLMAAICKQMDRKEEFLHYLELAVKYYPMEAVRLLRDVFPPDTPPEDYIKIATDGTQQ